MAAEHGTSGRFRRQTAAVPIVINEVLVRAVFFVRRFISELKEKQSVTAIEWKKIIPLNNRTIVRMMTIASGTFTAIDMADAAVHSATKSVDMTTFLSNMVLRVNFVGVGRLAIAIGTDTVMGIHKEIDRNARIKLQKEQLYLLDAKIYYKQAEMWIAAEDAGTTIEEAYKLMEDTTAELVNAVVDIQASLDHIDDMIPKVEEKNPGLKAELADILKWG